MLKVKKMDLKFSRFFVFIFINLMNLCNSNVLEELSYKDIFNLHHAFVIERLKWDSGLISFKIDRNFTDIEVIIIAIAMYEIEKSSCIRFAAHNPINGPNYVMIRKDLDHSHCAFADVGCLNIGEQKLYITATCIESVLHELLHTIGFNHHHNRSDRDKFVTIHREKSNITDEAFLINYGQFIKFDQRIEYLTPFDYHSVMLYDNGVITSKTKGVEVQSFQIMLSEYDKILLNRFYDCDSVCKRKSTIFYEDEFGMSLIINYHELERAKKYIVSNEVSEVNDRKENTNIEQEELVVIESEKIYSHTSTVAVGQSENPADNVTKENLVKDEEEHTKGLVNDNEKRLNNKENIVARDKRNWRFTKTPDEIRRQFRNEKFLRNT